MVAFIVESPEGVRRLEFDADEVRIGRADDNEIVLENESRCSRAHARIRRTAAGWALEDLDSANGTRMDGLKIRRVVLERGASFAIGETSITFLGSTDDAAPRPPDAEGSPQDPVVTRPLPEVPRYAALRWLGEGAVFRALAARHEPSGEIEVLRVPRARFSDRADFEPWLEQWLADWSRIEEPGLVRLDRLAAGEGAIILRERLAEAGTLADRLQSEGRQELSAVVELGLAVARPLAALHQAGMAHGGLTASCLRLYAEGSPRLSGPGHPPGFRGLVAEAHMASLHLSAPECFTPQGVSGRRSDVYALGGILHQLALGFAPNEGKSLEAIEKSVMKGLYKAPVERRPEMPAPLSDLIVACLKTEPAERPTSATEIQEALEDLRGELGQRRAAGARPIQGRERAVGERQDQPKKSLRHRVISWSITFVLFLILNGGVYLYLTRKPINSMRDRSRPVAPPALPGDPGSTDSRRVELLQLVMEGRASAALTSIEAWRDSGTLDPGEASELERYVKQRFKLIVGEATEAFDVALAAGRREDAARLLDRLEQLQGKDEPEVRRRRAVLNSR